MIFGQPFDDRRSNLDGVLHLALGEAGMGADAVDIDHRGIGRKGLVLKMADGLAIDGVGKVGAELAQIDIIDAAADLFVGREQQPNRAVLELWIAEQNFRRIHDRGDAGLVVGAEQRGAVAGDDVVADLVGKGRVLVEPDHLARIARQHDIAALIIVDDLRFHARAGAIRRSVHMGAEADHRHRLIGGGRQRGIDIAMAIELGVDDAELAQFTHQQSAEHGLFGRGRAALRGGVGLGVDRDVAQKTLGDPVLTIEATEGRYA